MLQREKISIQKIKGLKEKIEYIFADGFQLNDIFEIILVLMREVEQIKILVGSDKKKLVSDVVCDLLYEKFKIDNFEDVVNSIVEGVISITHDSKLLKSINTTKCKFFCS